MECWRLVDCENLLQRKLLCFMGRNVSMWCDLEGGSNSLIQTLLDLFNENLKTRTLNLKLIKSREDDRWIFLHSRNQSAFHENFKAPQIYTQTE